MKQKLLSVLLALTFCLSLLPGTALAAEPVETLTQDNVSDGTLELTAGKDYQLGNDITITQTISISGTVTLDLNGHVLKKTGSGSIIRVNSDGDLTLTDSQTTGAITGGDTSYGGGVYVGGGQFTMAGGKIEGCQADTNGGGVYIENGSFTMEGGKIVGCSAFIGGGVCISSGTFTMAGGSIADCSSSSSFNNISDAVYVASGTMNAHGGVVDGTVYNEGKITSTGTPASVTVFYSNVTNSGGTIDYGVFYDSGLTSTTQVNFFTDDQTLYKTAQVFGNKLVPPKAPTKDYFIFEGWYAPNNTSKQTFPCDITSSDSGKSYTAKFKDTSSIKSKDELTNAIANGASSIKLGGDITIDTTLEINGTVTLDLNGYVLKYDNTTKGSVIQVNENGDLTLKDSQTTGAIKGGNAANGGGVYVDSGKFTMESGKIADCQAERNGGGVYVDNGTFTMKDGKIEGCQAIINGGGVYIKNGTFTMKDGKIEGCQTKNGGGGVYIENGSFTMEGGSIVNCSSSSDNISSGVFVDEDGTMNAHGGVVDGTVYNNEGTITSTGTPTSVTAFYGNVINYSTGTINYGVFYGNVLNENDAPINNYNYTVAFSVDDTITETAQVFGNKLVPPKAPSTESGLSFAGWYKTNASSDGIQTFPCDISSVPEDGYTAKFLDATNIQTAQDLIDAVTAGLSSIKLGKNITISQTLEVNHKITLDLNGYVLEYNSSNNSNNSGSVIQVNKDGDLTLKDSNSNATHKFNTASTPWTLDEQNGTKTVTGGVIIGGNATRGGGVNVASGGKFTMESGNIVGCQAAYGGGVYVGGTFTMEGGKIVGCQATANVNRDDGVCVTSGSTMNAHGGVVEDTAYNGGTITKSGTPSSFTTFYGKVTNGDFGAIHYGVFYGGLNSVKGIGTHSKVTFDLDGGVADTTPETQYFVGVTTAPAIEPDAPTKVGYTFGGWYKDETTQWNFKDSVTESLTLTAKWAPNHYTVTFDKNATDATGTMEPQGFTYDKEDKLTSNAFQRSGYTFAGWAESSTGTVQYEDQASVSNLTTADNGKVTLYAVWTPIPSGGGSSKPSTPSITVPVSSEKGSVEVKATVKSGTASVEISDKQINQVVAEGAENVTVDLTGLNNVESSTLPAHVVETTSNAEDVGLTVALPTGTVSLDSTALNSLPAGEDITVSVKRVPATDLNEAQQAAVGDMANIGIVVDVDVYVGNEKQSNFNGGKLTISVPYTPKKNEDPSKMTVWYIKDDGTIQPMGGSYDAEKKCFVFETTHLSRYVIVSVEDMPSFTDVPNDAYYADAVTWAVLNGITTGMTETTFGPDLSCTRAQIVTFLWRAAGQPEVEGNNPFSDVNESDYFYQAVLWAVENKITTGTTATTFAPEDTCTRAQAAAFIYRNEQANGGGFTDNWAFQLPFTDVPDWCYEAVAWCYMNGVTQGTSETTFSPNLDCSRAQIVTMLYRENLL